LIVKLKWRKIRNSVQRRRAYYGHFVFEIYGYGFWTAYLAISGRKPSAQKRFICSAVDKKEAIAICQDIVDAIEKSATK